MITGYNTDVPHRDVVFHVQTEDKGKSNPLIETLVYVGGRVLATRRSPYGELLEEGKGEKEIVSLMENQHRRVIAAIRAGKLDAKYDEAVNTGSRAVPVRPASDPPSTELTISAAVPTESADRTLDQVILDYLTSEADQEQLLLMVDGDNRLSLGSSAGLAIRTSSSKSGLAVAGARVAVRMISTVSEPCTLVSGQTDGEGSLRLNFDIPKLERGTAALIIVADSAIGTAEIKHLL
ncbi:MAG: hypothetical protein KDD47_10790 [Acidobacteria bacterium]|nr:hypothetical protein [Acidobacteriota bacterium]